MLVSWIAFEERYTLAGRLAHWNATTHKGGIAFEFKNGEEYTAITILYERVKNKR